MKRNSTIWIGALVIVVSFLCFAPTVFSVPEKSISASGFGVAPERAKSKGQAKLLARVAAIADAYWNLARMLEDVRVSGETTVQDCVTQDHRIYMAVDAFIKGALITSEEELDDGIYKVTMRLPLEGEKSLMKTLVSSGAVIPPATSRPKQHTGIQLTVKMRGINPVAKIYVDHQEILKFNKSSQYIYYDYLKIYDDDNEHEILLKAQTYGYKNYVIFKKKEGEVLLEKNLVAHGGVFNEYVCLAEFDYWSIECSSTNPYGL